jgi:hypothetical protein
VDGTLTRLDATGGSTLGSPLPAGPKPAQVVLGQNGAALALSGDPAFGSMLTYVAREPDPDRAGGKDGEGAGVAERPVPLEPGSRAVLLAGDGGSYAAVVYVLTSSPAADGLDAARPGGTSCRLALVDLRSGASEAAHTVCGAGDLPTALALETTAAGPVAYVAVWSRAAQGSMGPRAAGARIVAVQARTGAALATLPLAGLPRPASSGGSLILAAGPGGAGRRLYGVEALPGSETATWSDQEYEWVSAMSGGWHILQVAPGGLVAERAVALDFAPVGLSVAPDGAQAYAFNARDDSVMRIDLATGRAAALGRVAGYRAGGLAATSDRVYVANPWDHQVWVFDRHQNRRVQMIPVGREPVWIGALSAGPARAPSAARGTP